jgi:hypothetical protein
VATAHQYSFAIIFVTGVRSGVGFLDPGQHSVSGRRLSARRRTEGSAGSSGGRAPRPKNVRWASAAHTTQP